MSKWLWNKHVCDRLVTRPQWAALHASLSILPDKVYFGGQLDGKWPHTYLVVRVLGVRLDSLSSWMCQHAYLTQKSCSSSFLHRLALIFPKRMRPTLPSTHPSSSSPQVSTVVCKDGVTLGSSALDTPCSVWDPVSGDRSYCNLVPEGEKLMQVGSLLRWSRLAGVGLVSGLQSVV